MAKKNTNSKIMYVEPDGYFPKELRKKYGLGEYAQKKPAEKKTSPKKK